MSQNLIIPGANNAPRVRDSFSRGGNPAQGGVGYNSPIKKQLDLSIQTWTHGN